VRGGSGEARETGMRVEEKALRKVLLIVQKNALLEVKQSLRLCYKDHHLSA